MIAPAPAHIEAQLLALLHDFMREWRPSQAAVDTITLHVHLEQDLALDSLARTELLRRIEETFAVRLSEQAFLAETPHALLQAILQAMGTQTVIDINTTSAGPSLLQSRPRMYAPLRSETLVGMLDGYAEAMPDRVAIRIVDARDDQEAVLSYAALYVGAQRVAAGLQTRGLRPRQTVAIMLPTGADYFLSFFGILLAGGVPVPIYPPMRPSQIEEHLRRHVRLLNNAETFALITVPEAVGIARLLQVQVETLRHVVTATELRAEKGAVTWHRVPIRPQDLAFLQYTSGSTGDPKGVMLTHANVIANVRAMGRRVAITADDVFVSWLPLYHDMGLIGACFGSLYHASTLVVMSPLSFLARPLRWLWAIHEHRGTLSAAPNFAYDLCVRAAQKHDLSALDLSTWRMAFNGAEPVSPATLTRFTERFSAHGLRAEAITPVYGLAECSVGLALPQPGRIAPIDRVQRAPFIATGQAMIAEDTDSMALLFPACGQPLGDHQLRIVDDQGREVPDRQEGRVEFKGPSATTGYYRNPSATARLFPHDDDWLDSGDRGYLSGGDIYLTGRIKDVIIRGGRNLYPYELEQAIGDIPGIRKGCVAVFASQDAATASERLIVVAETRVSTAEQADLRHKIHRMSVDVLHTPPDEVLLVPPHTVLKTSSGKVRRTAMRALYERNAIGRGGRALWVQMARITLSGFWARTRRVWRRACEWAYAARVWALFAGFAPCVWVGLMVLPTERARCAMARIAARGLARLSGTAIVVEGVENLPNGPCIVVANHASFLDVYVLMAALPRAFHFVAKRELLNNRWLAAPLQRMGVLFVERFDPQRSAEDAQRLVAVAHVGQSLAFFPEGTFTRMPGLRAFRMGAFIAAAQANVPVVPVTLHGARSMLREGSWLPRKGALTITIAPPIAPEGNDWIAAVRLRDAVRTVILSGCGEPDLMA